MNTSYTSIVNCKQIAFKHIIEDKSAFVLRSSYFTCNVVKENNYTCIMALT